MDHPKKERTFVIIKPDGIQRSLVGEIIRRFERTGLKLVAMKFTQAAEETLWTHYNKDDAWFTSKGERIVADRTEAGLPIEKEVIDYGKDIIRALIKYMTAGPVVMMVWEGNQAVGVIKKLVGSTEPLTSDVGTIRGDLTVDSYAICSVDDRAVRNLIHASDSYEDAQKEISLWFKPEEIVNYRLVQEAILYDINLDGILE
ncbi:MAG: nucleoside-diphosphate kinase [Candidatus Zambryskibacteria bacterium CG10_big_fil_rev_8_21_14_0_10_42_12]|uniref:nucleoside-diphosphate kinase n=1 Tax=Candidatus Zambryskibacteria bacterium CG10_big_fil_rev_8_21_14_0_10_42_12 TaxID=1975115 RepID=A0A2H0QWF7_9BACT|nr:MAG: nucleoside-diphosphate kinase [Candidatus Zambryskibacteria bacterium CG10_big_fil_rev_8_21_14_0_10_42_12]